MKSKNSRLLYILLLIILLAASVSSLSFGAAELSIKEALGGFFGLEDYEFESTIMLSVRLPRLLSAIIAGAGLSLSGVLIQSVMGNELASPGTIGVNSGAGLAVAICLSAFPRLISLIPVAAFFGAFATTLIIVTLSKSVGAGKASVILAGIACTSLFGAAISFISVLDTDVLSIYTAFSVGGFRGVGTDRLIIPGFAVALCIIISIAFSARISALSIGDSAAAGLGIRTDATRMGVLLLASISASSAVSFAGLLGFVGLVVPHITRKLFGGRLRCQITAAPIIGAILLILADLAGRALFAPSEISVGIVTAFIGAPFFFFLLTKKGGRHNA